jgi:uncharacterized protein YajQ (UPF0234 family)
MPSFDIVSKTDLAEVDNALANIRREIETRFDFKGSACSLERKDDELMLEADDPFKMKQMHELIFTHFSRRKIDRGALDFKDPERASGDRLRQTILVKQGLDRILIFTCHPRRRQMAIAQCERSARGLAQGSRR